MKIGIISDIHGNIDALEVVLNALETANVDKVICLGDLVGGAAKSEEVIQRIIQLKNKCICVRGNREKYIIDGMPLFVHDEKIKINQEQLARNEWIKNHLSSSSLKYINNLPTDLIYKIDEKTIYISHYPMNKDGSFRKHIKSATSNENEEMFSGIEADIYLYGHTHERIFNTINNKIYINPGALGCPGKTNNATYGILEIKNNEINYEQLNIAYNVEKVISHIKTVAFPDYKNVLKFFYGKEY